MRLGQPGGRRQRTHEQRLHAQSGQQHRRCQARAAAADDQHRHLLIDGARSLGVVLEVLMTAEHTRN